MRSDLFGTNLESATTDRFTLQNPRMLRVALDGEVMARQGAMVAYQGEVDFAYQGSGGMGKFFKKAFTGEGMPLMKVTGRGDVFFADDAMEIHLVNLENDVADGQRQQRPRLRLPAHVGHQAGRGRVDDVRRRLQHHVHRHRDGGDHLARHARRPQRRRPHVRRHPGGGGLVDIAVPSVRRTAGASALIGRGSGEAFQLVFTGHGFVVVQASEGRIVAPHSH